MPFIVNLSSPYKDDPRFARYILAKIINDTQNSMSMSNYKLADIAVNEFLGRGDTSNDGVSSYSLVAYYIRTFSIEDKGSYLSIGDNKDERVYNSDRKLSDVIRLIEYGCKDSPPVPKISKVMNDIKNNLDDIYSEWNKRNSSRSSRYR